jgi:hypothetical protein
MIFRARDDSVPAIPQEDPMGPLRVKEIANSSVVTKLVAVAIAGALWMHINAVRDDIRYDISVFNSRFYLIEERLLRIEQSVSFVEDDVLAIKSDVEGLPHGGRDH